MYQRGARAQATESRRKPRRTRLGSPSARHAPTTATLRNPGGTPGRHETGQGPVGLPFPRCSRSHLRAPSRVVFRPSFTRRAFFPKSRWCSCSRRSGLFVIPTWIVFLFLTTRYFVVSRSEDIAYSLRAVRLVQRPCSSGGGFARISCDPLARTGYGRQVAERQVGLRSRTTPSRLPRYRSARCVSSGSDAAGGGVHDRTRPA